ncbi:MAG: restriction endonuclease [Candidatus Thiodiazotropha sp.]
MAKLNYNTKQKLIELAGTCFWYWNSFYTFLDSCGVSKRQQDKYPRSAYSKYDVMRNILGELEDKNSTEVINSIVSSFYRMKRAADDDVPDAEKAKRLLDEFRDVVGNDPIEKELEKRQREKSKQKYQESTQANKHFKNRLEELNKRFLNLHTTTEMTSQQRGFALEDLFCDLLELNEMEYKRPYRHTGEQIDGHMKYEKFDYLLETKWEKDPITQDALSIFDGKIRGKAQSTRGLFIAANGFDNNAVQKYSGDSPRIILMTGEDLALILCGRIDFQDSLKAKI